MYEYCDEECPDDKPCIGYDICKDSRDYDCRKARRIKWHHALATIAPGLLVVLVFAFVMLISVVWATYLSPLGSALLTFIWFCGALTAAAGVYYRDQERNAGLPTWTENRRAEYVQGTYGQSHTV